MFVNAAATQSAERGTAVDLSRCTSALPLPPSPPIGLTNYESENLSRPVSLVHRPPRSTFALVPSFSQATLATDSLPEHKILPPGGNQTGRKKGEGKGLCCAATAAERNPKTSPHPSPGHCVCLRSPQSLFIRAVKGFEAD